MNENRKMKSLAGILKESYGYDQLVKFAGQIKKYPQVQFSTNDQLKICVVLAGRFGLYDAADAIKRLIR